MRKKGPEEEGAQRAKSRQELIEELILKSKQEKVCHGLCVCVCAVIWGSVQGFVLCYSCDTLSVYSRVSER